MQRNSTRAARIGVLCFAMSFVAGCAGAQTAPEGAAKDQPETEAVHGVDKLPYLDQLPPPIDRKLFFGDPEISGSQISPNGEFISFIKPYKGVRNIWVKQRGEPFDQAKPITADTERPVTGYFWSEDSRYVLYVQDKGGNENYHIYAVDPKAKPEAETGVPPARDLTPFDKVRAYIYAVPETTPGKILIGLNDRAPALHDVYQLDIESGEKTLLIQNEQNIAGWVTDLSGSVRLALRQTPDGGTEILEVENGELVAPIYTCAFGESCNPLRFHKNGEQVYLVTNKGQSNLTRLTLMDADSGATELIESDPENQVDFGGATFSDATEELIATVYVGDRVRVYPRTEKFKSAYEFLKAELPEGEISISSLTNDDRYAKVVVSRDVDPGTVYLFDWQETTVEKLYESRPELPTEHLAHMQAIRYTARDGVEIPAYLTTPKGVPAENLAVVIQPHGGPWARNSWGYNSLHQFLANRGYAVLSMNFRGSTGYGKEFLNAGNNEWGTGVMQHDISDGVKYLIEQGIADPDRVAIMGGSYGGYATLAGLAFTPELYTAGVDIVGPSNIITLLNSIPAYWGPIKKIFTLRVGDPDDPADRERLKRQSPFFHVEQIDDPLLVIQGANDPRVNKAEADQIVVGLREAGQPVQYLVAPDEGHGFAGRENRLAMFAKIEKFLAKYLGGRYQEGMTPEVDDRLETLTVDVSTVEMPQKATGADAARTAPLPPVDASKFATGKFQYTTNMSVGERQMTIESTRVVKTETREGDKVFVITDSATTPQGEVQDISVLGADSLRPVSRSIVQGPVNIKLDYGNTEVTGTIEAGGQVVPIEVELVAPVFGGAAALEAVVSALPLSEGYETTLRSFEVGLHQRTRLWSLKVAASEQVTVAAGSYQAWQVVIEPLDGEGGGQTLWVSKDAPRVIVKSKGKLPPQMGGGTVTSELTSVADSG